MPSSQPHVIFCTAGHIDHGKTALVKALTGVDADTLPGDRFAVRTFSPLDTVGGGVVRDAQAGPHKRRAPAALESLRRLAGPPEEAVEEFFRLAGEAAVTAAQVARGAGRRTEEVAALAHHLQEVGRLIPLWPGAEAPRYLHTQVYQVLGERVVVAVGTCFRESPYRLYMPAADLPGRLRGPADSAVLGAILGELERQGRLERSGNRLALPERRVRLPAGERELMERIEQAFREGGLAPPAEEEVRERLAVKPEVWARLVGLLVEGERLVRVADRVTYHREHYETARRAVQEALAERGGLTVAELRDRLGVSRKFSLALLEHFNRIHLTRREGERHVGGTALMNDKR